MVFALDYAAFGVVMILFLLLEPAGLMGIWHRVRNSVVARRAGPSA
jgi:branched-chain amino acid transport system permease protein